MTMSQRSRLIRQLPWPLGGNLHARLFDLLVGSYFEVLENLSEQKERWWPKADENGKPLSAGLSILV
jgi:hypothetical protein